MRPDALKTNPLTDEAGEVRELTSEDMDRFRPAAEVLPEQLVAVLPKRKPGQRGAQKKPTKEPVTIRYSRDVLEYFRATGPGFLFGSTATSSSGSTSAAGRKRSMSSLVNSRTSPASSVSGFIFIASDLMV